MQQQKHLTLRLKVYLNLKQERFLEMSQLTINSSSKKKVYSLQASTLLLNDSLVYDELRQSGV